MGLKPIFKILCSWAIGLSIGAYDNYIFFVGISFLRFFVGFGITRYGCFENDYLLNLGVTFGKNLL